MVLNYIWIGFFLIGFLVALYKLAFLGQMDIFSTMMTGLFDSAKTGFEISIGLTGIMALWLGFMKIGEGAGIVNVFARGVQPFFKTLFRGVPKGHTAYGNIAMNFSANMLGLDNAATPLGLKAMGDLQELNPKKDTASDAQIMFLVLNTAGITLIPSSVIAIRQSMAIEQGIKGLNAADIFLPILISTFVAFTAGILITAAFQRINIFKWPVLIFILGFGGLIFGLAFWLQQFPPEQMSKYVGLIGSMVILLIIITFLTAGFIKKLNVYDLFIEGAKEGFTTAIKIIPYLVAMLAAISVFRNSGCMDYLVGGIAFIVAGLGLNTDFVPALPVAFMKPLSGGGARGLMVDVMKQYGVNSFPAKIASIIQGSTETTFYVLAVYFGSINVKNTRYALLCGLLADGIGLVTAILVGYLFFH
ncbi:hypothetical protein DBR32_10815 [Taibaiella sp. KBW10]|uniref:nucleoside recognition domain-containing protein n=1 Tax=Taibaiella sp. KBW10 TaxID=2153357 RepID=UPI000F598326|nr:spore maturation protein [Taibaiella sp. KBW10]RQO30073.1 hypothetical protein DBR32_10815 [Taibaiella sp. KBW10]